MLDQKDRAILRELREDSKKTTKTIAENTGIPRTTVHDRISKMEENGIIQKFTVIPDYTLIDEGTTAFIFASYDPQAVSSQREVAESLSKLDGVYEVHLISGEWDILAKVRGPDVETIGELVVERLRDITGVAKTVTSTVFRTIKDDV